MRSSASTSKTRRDEAGLGRTWCRPETVVRIVGEKGLEALGTVLYLGHIPLVSGTVGSVPGVLLFWLCRRNTALFAGLAGVLFVAGILAARYLERKTGDPDPSCVVIDEMVGMMAVLALLEWSWMNVIAAFVAFRFFDIAKPFPARQLEQKRGGLGIMLDDIVAAAYTWVAVRMAFAVLAH